MCGNEQESASTKRASGPCFQLPGVIVPIATADIRIGYACKLRFARARRRGYSFIERPRAFLYRYVIDLCAIEFKR